MKLPLTILLGLLISTNTVVLNDHLHKTLQSITTLLKRDRSVLINNTSPTTNPQGSASDKGDLPRQLPPKDVPLKPFDPILRDPAIPPLPPVPHIVVSDKFKPIIPQDVAITIDVIGNIATTTYDITFFNPNYKQLEGEFIIPLSENQNVSALALDINGKMRDGVVVEKQKARQTFEAIVNRRVDPALAEKTAGNQFKLRIYPFAGNGTRRIKVTLEEQLRVKNGAFYYALPLNFNQTLKSFSLNVQSYAAAQPQVTTDLKDFTFTKQNQIFLAQFSAQNYLSANNFSFLVPNSKEETLFTHSAGDTTYFYSNIAAPVSEKNKVLPAKITVFWDSSLSGSKRDIAAEKALLKAYLERIKNLKVEFITFNLDIIQKKEFEISAGDLSALEKEIDSIVYDGATKFDTLDIGSTSSDEILIFTDGISSFGDSKIALGDVPIYTINSSPEFERGLLQGTPQKSLGSFINLTTLDTAEALHKLTTKSVRVLSYVHDSKISEVYPPIGTEVTGVLSFAGLMHGSSAELTVNFGFNDDEIIRKKTIKITSGTNNAAVERLWAKQKINFLELDPKVNKDEILKLGQTYSIVTAETSLLVLENVSDYVQYQITPPAELLDEYNRLLTIKNNNLASTQQSALEDAVNQAKLVKEWWEKEFTTIPTKSKPFQPLKPLTGTPNLRNDSDDEAMQRGREQMPRDEGGARANSMSILQERQDNSRMEMTKMAAPLDFVSGNMAAPAGNNKGDTPLARVASNATIQIKGWNPDTPYLKILRKSSDAELYKDYLKLKNGFDDQPSFYFDVSDEFIRRKQPKNALIVISNIAEMKLDNVELLRIAANKLLGMGYTQYSVELFKKILELRGEDPQSYRDLALAYQQNDQAQEALEMFYTVLSKQWTRFNNIKQVVFVEMNRLIAKNPKLNLENIDQRVIFAMPVDIRISLSWSTDNTDIDLHVKDPYDENCFYGRRLTTIGGRYTNDFTDGFGPEEFMLKKAAKGTYQIKTNNFGDRRQSISGPTTLYLDIFTYYGTAEETHQRILVRTENIKEDNVIGEINFN
ncbi:MAG: VIT domain-containing protein [Bdellovibrionota bacterium]|jgi:tetratricopeptide (TPR) repeat protein